MDAEQTPALPRGAFARIAGVDFDRMLFFTDAVYAIAMTLLIVSVEVPRLSGDPNDPAVLWEALTDAAPQILSFFIAFLILGRYWLAHHKLATWLRATDRRLMSWNLLYLAFVAFLPFPTALAGSFENNPLSVSLFAIILGAISGMETVLFVSAYRHGLLRSVMPRDAYRLGVVTSTLPVGVFLLSLPVAFWVSPTWALLSWLLVSPLEFVLGRRASPAAKAVLDDGPSSDPGVRAG